MYKRIIIGIIMLAIVVFETDCCLSRRIPTNKKITSAKLNYCNQTEKAEKNCLNGGKCLTVIVNNIYRFPKCLCPRKFQGENCNRSLFASRTKHRKAKKASRETAERNIQLEESLNRDGFTNCENLTDRCLNGGTCYHFKDLDIKGCHCLDGFSGNTCNLKTT